MLSAARLPSSSPLRILIVDADRRVRDSLADLICCATQLEAVAAVGGAEAAVEAMARCSPDVVVIDLNLSDAEDGALLMGRLRNACPATTILVMSWAAESQEIAASADGLLDKNAAPEVLVAAIAGATRHAL